MHTTTAELPVLNWHRSWFSRSDDQDCRSLAVLNWKEIFLLFLAVLSLCRCTQSFSSCGQWGLLSSCGVRISHCSGFSCNYSFSNCSWRQAQTSRHVGLVARRHVEPSRTRDQTRVPCIAGQILNHWTTSKVLERNYSFLGAEAMGKGKSQPKVPDREGKRWKKTPGSPFFCLLASCRAFRWPNTNGIQRSRKSTDGLCTDQLSKTLSSVDGWRRWTGATSEERTVPILTPFSIKFKLEGNPSCPVWTWFSPLG